MNQQNYHLCISFAGTEREYARSLANELHRRGANIFFDEFEKALLWGRFLHDALGSIYYEANYAIVLLSYEYYNRMYTDVERKALLISGRDKILPVRMDNADIPISLRGIGYIDSSSESVETIAALAMDRLRRDGLIPSWPEGVEKIYHGTTASSAIDIKINGVTLEKCRSMSEFGRGFYTTRDREGAQKFAELKSHRTDEGGAVVELVITLAALKKLESLSFVIPTKEYFEFVKKCLLLGDGHYGTREFYDVVYGPLSAYPQRMVFNGMEQVSFHTAKAISLLRVQDIHYLT